MILTYLVDLEDQAVHLLRGGRNLVGRGLDADVVVRSKLASRAHCLIVLRQDHSVEVRDLRSRNGTWIGDDPVFFGALVPGAECQIGGQRFRLEQVKVPECGLQAAPVPASLIEALRAGVLARSA